MRQLPCMVTTTLAIKKALQANTEGLFNYLTYFICQY